MVAAVAMDPAVVDRVPQHDLERLVVDAAPALELGQGQAARGVGRLRLDDAADAVGVDLEVAVAATEAQGRVAAGSACRRNLAW